MLLALDDNTFLNTNHIVSIIKHDIGDGRYTIEIHMVASSRLPNGAFTFDAIDENEADQFIEMIITNS